MLSHLPTPIATRRALTAPALFRSARASRDLPIVAFAAALFLGFVAQAGAFLPRIDGAGAPVVPAASAPIVHAAAAPAPLACETAGSDGAEVPRT